MKTQELKKLIKDEMFLRHGIKIGDDDPIIHLFLTNQIIATMYAQPFIDSFKECSSEIENTIKKIATTLEDFEVTTSTLISKTKDETKACALAEIESAKQCIAETIKKAVYDNIAEPLAMSKSEINKINDQLRNGSGTVSKTGWFAIILLIFSTTLFAFLAIYINLTNSTLQKENIDLQHKWAVERQERIKHFEVIERLPKSVQSQYDIESKKYEKSINQKLTN